VSSSWRYRIKVSAESEMTVDRILVPALMTGRELTRRRVALGLLTALPLAFYAASAGHAHHAATSGGISMAFSVAGASIFAALTARPVDRRLVLAGYRPVELLAGRLLLLELFGLVVAAVFSVVMVLGTGPPRPWVLAEGVCLVAVTSVPFGLAVGALVPHELEGVMVLIGVVGIQLTLESTQALAKVLPFWGPERLIEDSIDGSVPTGAAVPAALLYALALLAAAAYLMRLRAPRRSVLAPS
jgi:hypothetical protein